MKSLLEPMKMPSFVVLFLNGLDCIPLDVTLC